MEVGIRELRLNLSRYVARARAGTNVIVTDHGRPVARLGPIEDGETKRARLIREGKLTPARPSEEHCAPTADPPGRRRSARQRDGAGGPPLIAYFDASAFVKLIVDEPGSEDARDLFTTATSMHSSWLLVSEANAALVRAHRDRRLSPRGAERALDVLRRPLAEVEALELDQTVAERAGDFAAALGLRGGDAVHLASYELVEGEESVLVSADGALARAALSLGHAVAVPGG